MIAVSLNNIKEELEEQKADYIVVDTPGQLELFAFRESGPFVVNNLEGENKVVLFLFDFTVASSPFNFLSTTLLYNSLKLRLNLPQLSVLTKTDLSKTLTRKIMDWCANSKLLEEDMSNEKNSERYLIGNEILKAFSKLSLIPAPIPISSITWNGMLNLGSAISNILRGGEEFIE
jgi:hypothetical protein